MSTTVAIVRYELFGRKRRGVCSTFLMDKVSVGDILPIFVNNNPDFRLPTDPNRATLMVPVHLYDTNSLQVGPGTGIAPFRAMLQERGAKNNKSRGLLNFSFLELTVRIVKLGATGSNILYFGCRFSSRDFLYKDELGISLLLFQNFI